MVEPLAVLVEVALVVARGRERGVRERQRRKVLPSWSGSRTPTTQGLPKRSPMMRVSPPALTMARVMPCFCRISMPRSTEWPLAMPPRSMRMPGRVKNTVVFFGSSTMWRQLMPGSACVDGLLVGMHAFLEVVEIADAGVGDVERAVRELGILAPRSAAA